MSHFSSAMKKRASSDSKKRPKTKHHVRFEEPIVHYDASNLAIKGYQRPTNVMLVECVECFAQLVHSLFFALFIATFLAFQCTKGLLQALKACIVLGYEVFCALPLLLVLGILTPFAAAIMIAFMTTMVWEQVQTPLLASVDRVIEQLGLIPYAIRAKAEERLIRISMSFHLVASHFESLLKERLFAMNEAMISPTQAPSLEASPPYSLRVPTVSLVPIVVPSSQPPRYDATTMNRPVSAFDDTASGTISPTESSMSSEIASPPDWPVHLETDTAGSFTKENSDVCGETMDDAEVHPAAFWGTKMIPNTRRDHEILAIARGYNVPRGLGNYFPIGDQEHRVNGWLRLRGVSATENNGDIATDPLIVPVAAIVEDAEESLD